MSFKVRLGEIAEIQTGPFGSQLHKEDYVDEGTPIITVEHLGSNIIIHNNLPLVSDIDKERLKKYQLQKGDVVFSRVGSVDRRAYVRDEEDGWLFSGRCLRVRVKSENVNSLFLSYYFGLESFKEYVRRIAVGATMPSLNTKIMSELEVEIPSLEEQKAIANILSSLDEKIELNNQMNKTLEEMAQDLFKRWFVDFEFPNEDGEPYKSSGGEMVGSELGMIPKGWSINKFGDIVENYDSKRIPLSKREREKRENIYRYYGAASIADYVDDYIFDGTYVLMGEDGTVIDNEGFPILQYVWGKFWVNNHAHVLKGKDNASSEFIYLYLKGTNVAHLVTGAVQPKINQKNMNSLDVALANKVILNKFDSIISPVFEQVKNLVDENKQLIELRDALLPKLMSGEIRVTDLQN